MTEESSSSRPQFGGRLLQDPDKVFEQNAWDNVDWDEEQEAIAKTKVDANSCQFLDEEKQREYEEEASKFWNDFYNTHQENFFKDRQWLFTEFPELSPNFSSDSSQQDLKFNILEIGCGAGNTVFPILQTNIDERCFVYCCDFSTTAIDLVKANRAYDEKRCHAFVCDVTADDWQVPFAEDSLDVVVLIFVLSSISPERMKHVAKQIQRYLKPGGLLLLRDYGRYDMAQLRFKKGRCLNDNFYVRGDGTRVYFFTQEDLTKLFTDAGLQEESNVVDRRLQVNRGKQLKMYRVWIQCKYRKPLTS